MRQLNTWILSLFFLSISFYILWNTQLSPIPFPTFMLDEQAHYSYTLHLLNTHRWWPDFHHFLMIDPATGLHSGEPDYINHPPTFYWLMELIHRAFPHIEPIRYRLATTLLYLLAFACYVRLAFRLAFHPLLTLVYLSLPIFMDMPTFSGFYTNDAPVMVGGMLSCLVAVDWVNNRRSALAASLLLLALTLASVKLTGLLLVGGFIFCILLCNRQALEALPRSVVIAGCGWGMVLTLPFLYFIYRYGSPAPNTMGQQYLLTHHPISRWLFIPLHGDFYVFIKLALKRLWQFSPGRWNIVGMVALLLAWLRFLLMPAHRRALSPALRCLTGASLIATAMTLCIHLLFSYQRYIDYDWVDDMLSRYYFPLLPAYGASIVGGLQRPRRA